MTNVRIKARVNVRSGWVELDPPRALIPHEATVSWVFTGVPDDLQPALLFESFAPAAGASTRKAGRGPLRGPFAELSRQGDEVHGSRFAGPPGEYVYKICLVGKDGSDPLIRRLDCRGVHAGGLVQDPGPRAPETGQATGSA